MDNIRLALESLWKGKKIRLAHWPVDVFIHKVNEEILSNEGVIWTSFDFLGSNDIWLEIPTEKEGE